MLTPEDIKRLARIEEADRALRSEAQRRSQDGGIAAAISDLNARGLLVAFAHEEHILPAPNVRTLCTISTRAGAVWSGFGPTPEVALAEALKQQLEKREG